MHLAGTTVSRATLHNQDFISEKGIGIGDVVTVRKAGDIIPEVLCVNKHTAKSIYKFPEICPSCGSRVIREEGEAAIRCINPDCSAQLLRNLIHFCSRDAMDIEGLGPTIIENFVKCGLITKTEDIYSLTFGKINDMQLEGFKDKSINNIVSSVERSKNNDLAKLVFALGIRHIGAKAAKLLSDHFKTMDNIIDKESILEIDGFGDIMAESVCEFFENPKSRQLVARLAEAGVNMNSKSVVKDERFAGKTFVLTGTLQNYTRKEAGDIIESFGGKTSSSVSKKTSYVLAGSEAGSKLDKANALGIEILSEEEFTDLIK